MWADTFTNSFDPGIGQAAVAVLEVAGCGVVVPQPDLCCGLIWIANGQLDIAGKVLRRTLNALQAGVPVVGLEPVLHPRVPQRRR